jgi:hypothetical protein
MFASTCTLCDVVLKAFIYVSILCFFLDIQWGIVLIETQDMPFYSQNCFLL